MNFARVGLRRVFTIILIALLASNQTLAVTTILPMAANGFSGFINNDWPEWRTKFGAIASAAQGNNILVGAGRQRPAPKTQEAQADRDRRIAKINIYPGNVTVTVGEAVQLTAVARDSNGLAIPGATDRKSVV